MKMEYVEGIRKAYRDLETPLVNELMATQDRIRARWAKGPTFDLRAALDRCSDAYSQLLRAAEDQVRQQYGLMPVHYRRRG